MYHYLFLLLITITIVSSEINLERRDLSVETVTVVAVEDSTVRRLDVAYQPNAEAPGSLAVVGTGFSASLTNATVDAALDVAGFSFTTPLSGDDLGFYFGYLDADATYDVESGLGSVSAALAEVVAAFYSVIVYEDRDETPGLQYNLYRNHFYCVDGIEDDCIRGEYSYEFKDHEWNPIEVTRYNCSDDDNAVSDDIAPCTVYKFTAATTDGVVRFDMHVASQPVLIGAVELEPNFSKLDVTIQYNWSSTEDCEACSIALIGATAGRVTTGNLEFNTGASTSSTTFVAGDFATYFSWASEAAVQGIASDLFFRSITLTNLTTWSEWECDLGSVECLAYIPQAAVQEIWRIVLTAFAGFGWDTTILIFSWEEVQPEVIFWDPSVGGGSYEEVQMATESDDMDLSDEPLDNTDNTASFYANLFLILIISLLAF